MKSSVKLSIVTAACLLTACASPMKPSPAAGPSPLLVASCPELTPLQPSPDGTVTMGALLSKLTAVAGTYNECREAALAK